MCIYFAQKKQRTLADSRHCHIGGIATFLHSKKILLFNPIAMMLLLLLLPCVGASWTTGVIPDPVVAFLSQPIRFDIGTFTSLMSGVPWYIQEVIADARATNLGGPEQCYPYTSCNDFFRWFWYNQLLVFPILALTCLLYSVGDDVLPMCGALMTFLGATIVWTTATWNVNVQHELISANVFLMANLLRGICLIVLGCNNINYRNDANKRTSVYIIISIHTIFLLSPSVKDPWCATCWTAGAVLVLLMTIATYTTQQQQKVKYVINTLCSIGFVLQLANNDSIVMGFFHLGDNRSYMYPFVLILFILSVIVLIHSFLLCMKIRPIASDRERLTT